MQLHYLSADQLLQDAQRLALQVLADGFHPELLIALWRGGTPVAIGLHEVLVLAGHNCEHTVIGASSYSTPDRQHALQFTGLDGLFPLLEGKQRILLVDDVFDTGRTLTALVTELQQRCGARQPDIRIAAPWYKPQRSQSPLRPDYFLHSTEAWLVFPHELVGLSRQQILAKPGSSALLATLADLPSQHS